MDTGALLKRLQAMLDQEARVQIAQHPGTPCCTNVLSELSRNFCSTCMCMDAHVPNRLHGMPFDTGRSAHVILALALKDVLEQVIDDLSLAEDQALQHMAYATLGARFLTCSQDRAGACSHAGGRSEHS